MIVISVVIFDSTFLYKMAIVVEILSYKINSRRNLISLHNKYSLQQILCWNYHGYFLFEDHAYFTRKI